MIKRQARQNKDPYRLRLEFFGLTQLAQSKIYVCLRGVRQEIAFRSLASSRVFDQIYPKNWRVKVKQ